MDISTLLPQPVVLHPDAKLPLTVTSPAHSTRRRAQRFHFEDLAPHGEFAHVIAKEFLVWNESRRSKSAQMYLVVVRKFFRALIPMLGANLPSVITEASAADWHAAAQSWTNDIDADLSIEASTRSGYISCVRQFLHHLQNRGKIPRFALPRVRRKASAPQKRKRTLAEVALEFHKSHDSQPPPEVAALDEEIQALWRQLRIIPEADRPTGMLRLIDLHLSNLREAAEKEIRSIWHNYLQAEARIAEADIEAIYRFLDENQGRFSRSLGSGRGSWSIFGDIKNLLAYIEHRHGGLIPSRFEDPALYRLITNKHSVADISACLYLTTDTVVPFLVPILIDTAMNVGSVYELKTDCLRETEVPGEKKVVWTKWRSERVHLDLYIPVGSRTQLEINSKASVSAPRAIECLLKMRERLVPYVFPEERDLLLLVRKLAGAKDGTSDGSVGPLTEKNLGPAWDRFRSRHLLLADLPINMDQIRGTVLLKTALETKGDIIAVNQKAKHKKYSTSLHYVEDVSTAILNENKARQVQDFIFVAATGGADDLRRRFGIGPEDAARILSQARRKGFGLKCLDDKKGAAPGTVPGKTCNQYTHCAVCTERLVVEDTDVAAEMHAFRAHILTHQARLIRERPDRWREVWGPFVLFLNIALERMRPDIRVKGAALAKSHDFSYFDLD